MCHTSPVFVAIGFLELNEAESAFPSKERDQLLIHNLPVVIGALGTDFIPLDLNEARSRKRDPATSSRSTGS
jgi:hypothetical protein